MNVAEKIAAKVLGKIVTREEAEWPPVCSGLIYQPERPLVDSIIENGIDKDAAPAKSHSK